MYQGHGSSSGRSRRERNKIMTTKTAIPLRTVEQIQRRHEGHWFDASTMRFFRTRLLSEVHLDTKQQRSLFVTSEPYCWDGERVYTVRAAAWTTGDIDTVGEMGQFATARLAQAAAARVAQGGAL